MTARDWTEELTAYIDGALDAETSQALEAQLAIDPALKALEQRLRKAVAQVALVSSPEPSAALRRAVLTQLEAPPSGWERVKAFFTASRWVPVGALAAAGLSVLVVVTGRDAGVAPESEEQLFVAQNIDVLEDYEVVGLDGADDFEVVAQLHELEEARP
ncbi:MAG: hypothetical protein JNG84_02805 [Archangium sp.]|nr:hypothetical protein [Archangium sp.]